MTPEQFHPNNVDVAAGGIKETPSQFPLDWKCLKWTG